MMNACEIDEQRVHVILRDNVRNMKKSNGLYGATKRGQGRLSACVAIAYAE